MKYLEIVNYLKTYIPAGDNKWNKNFGLEKISYLLERLGNPHLGLKFVHVGGTSGKGSTSTFIASILTQSGYKTGLHVSPDVITLRERMQINGQCVSIKRFKKIFNQIKPVIEKMAVDYGVAPSFYEILLVMSFVYFKEENCQVVVVEVGIGGKLDATNIIDAHYQIITNVGLDHMSILGNTKELILSDKQEIIKNSSVVVSGIGEPNLRQIISKKTASTNSKIYFLGIDFASQNIRHSRNLQLIFDLKLKEEIIKNIELNLPGLFQVDNASLAFFLALKMSTEFKLINEKSIRLGISLAKIPGRLQVFGENPTCIVDGAHNPDKMLALVTSLKFYFPGQKFITIFRYKKRKDINQSLELLRDVSQKVIITSSKKWGDMGWDGDLTHEDRSTFDGQDYYIFENNLEKAFLYAKDFSAKNGIGILATGSLYMVNEVLTYAKK